MYTSFGKNFSFQTKTRERERERERESESERERLIESAFMFVWILRR